MKLYTRHQAGPGAVRALLWGAAHSFDLSGVLLSDTGWGGFEADAEALRGDWAGALTSANEDLDDVREAGEAE